MADADSSFVGTINGKNNPVTRSQVVLKPAFQYTDEDRGQWFIDGLNRWCELAWEIDRRDPKVVNSDVVAAWYEAYLSHTSTSFSLLDAILEDWGPPQTLTAVMSSGGKLSPPTPSLEVAWDGPVEEVKRTRPEDQALPTAGREPVQDRLAEFVNLVRERRELGIQRYGRPLETGNGRDAGRDLVEELVDAACYAMQLRLERRESDQAIEWWKVRCRQLSDDVNHLSRNATRAIDYIAGRGGNVEDVREARRILNGKREEENPT